MRKTVLLFLVVTLMLAPLSAHGEGIRDKRPSFVFGEIGGKAILFSAGYEHYLTNNFGLGIGAVGWGGSGGGVGLFPVYVSFIPIGDVHSLYLSAGVTYIAGVSNWDADWVEWVGTFSIGYQFQSEGGFFVRPTTNTLFRDGEFVVIPGIAIGGSF
jgi:hypothetical protein